MCENSEIADPGEKARAASGKKRATLGGMFQSAGGRMMRSGIGGVEIQG
jgi:hypothetical protein